MRQVQEIIYVVPEERDAYIEKHLNPSKEITEILWTHGIRNQYFFQLDDYILQSFEYVGRDFFNDMAALGAYPEMKKYLVRRRRKEVPLEDRKNVNWWAPLKKMGTTLTESPFDEEEELTMEEQYRSMLSGYMSENDVIVDFEYDEDDWSESVHI